MQTVLSRLEALRAAIESRLGIAWVLPAIFLCLVAPLGVVLGQITPPGQVADETVHAIRADALSRGQVIGHRARAPADRGSDPDRPLVAGVNADAAIFDVANPNYWYHMMTWVYHGGIADRDWSGASDQFFEIGPVAAYCPVFYVPAAAAIGVSRAAGAGPLRAFMIARAAHALLYALLGAAALLLARRGRALLFCVLAFPMSLSLGASLNEDGLLIATAVLGFALLSGIAPERGQGRRLLGGAACLTLVCLAKPPYLPMLGVLLLPLPAAWRSRAGRVALLRRAGLIGACAAPVLVWTLIGQLVASAPLARSPYVPGPLYHGAAGTFASTDPRAQLGVLLHAPSLMLSLPWRALVDHDWYVEETIGILGWLNLRLPGWLLVWWQWAAIASVPAGLLAGAAHARGRLREGVLQSVFVLALFALAVVAIELSQYLVWTRVGEEAVRGVQGRYFEPLLPMVALLLPLAGRDRTLRVSTLAAAALAWVPAGAAAATLMFLPPMVVSFFYLH